MWNHEERVEVRFTTDESPWVPPTTPEDQVEDQTDEMADLRAELEAVRTENETLRGLVRDANEESASYQSDILRSTAEFANYRKRILREKEAAHDASVHKVLTSLLPVLDDLAAAREHGDLEDGPFASIARKFDSILASHGLIVVNEAGVEFDPEIHEAVIAQPVEGFEEETVARVFRTGYSTEKAGLIRAAQVMVAK